MGVKKRGTTRENESETLVLEQSEEEEEETNLIKDLLRCLF